MFVLEHHGCLAKIFSYSVNNLKDIIKLKSINNICSDTVIYYSGEMCEDIIKNKISSTHLKNYFKYLFVKIKCPIFHCK